MIRLATAAAIMLAAPAALAAPLPAWTLGRWVGVALIEPATLADAGANLPGAGPGSTDRITALLGAIAIDIRPDAVTSVPTGLHDLIEGDGLSATPGGGTFRTLYAADRQYRVIGHPVAIEAETDIRYVSITMRHCVVSAGSAVTRSGHSVPPRRADRCDPVRLYSLPDGRIGWPTYLGWLVLERVEPRAR